MIAPPDVTTQLVLFISGPNDALHYDSRFGKAVRAMCNRFKFGATWSLEHYGLSVRILTTDAALVAEAVRALTSLAKRWDGRSGLEFKKEAAQ